MYGNQNLYSQTQNFSGSMGLPAHMIPGLSVGEKQSQMNLMNYNPMVMVRADNPMNHMPPASQMVSPPAQVKFNLYE